MYVVICDTIILERRKIMTKKNLVIIVLSTISIILITLIVLVTTNTISFNSDNNINNSESDELENNNEIDWSSHLLSLHLLDAKITRTRSINLGDNIDLNKTVTISKEELKDLLSNLKDKKLVKTYSQGRGGPNKDQLIVVYEYNNERYEFKIYSGSIYVDKLDDNFKRILNNHNYEETGNEYKNMERTFYYYKIEGYSENIFDEYFK